MRRGLVLAVAVAACVTGRGPGAPEEGQRATGTGAADATATPASTATPAPSPRPAPPAAAGGAGAKAAGAASAGEEAAAAPAAGEAAPAPLPLPIPPPELPPLEPPLAVDLSDPLELLWGHRIEFVAGGEPLVTIRLMEGQREISFRPRGRARVVLRGGGAVEVPAGARLSVKARGTAPAAVVHQPLLAEAPIAGRARLEELRREYEAQGVVVLSRRVGGVYGIGGRVVDNRRELLLAASDGTREGARAAVEELRARHGARPTLHSEVVARPRGTLELRADAGAPLGEADAALYLEVEGDAGFVVERVEHERSPAARSREDRAYRGRLYVTLDADGALAAIHGVPLEELLRGIVPSEMPGSSHLEALKAQAVTARSNVLAQIGMRHLTDPFMLCAEVHCQAYRGDGARTPRTDEAVRATRGEALFGRSDRVLVDAVYSAMCGGHGEDNDKVWGNTPDASLRGRPDLPPGEAARWKGGLSTEGKLREFLAAAPAAYCRRPAAARKDRFRWERRFVSGDLDRLAGQLAVGHVRRLAVASRGVSGRARLLEIEGDAGRAEVAGELRIRRLLGNLPSAMFVVDDAEGGVVLRGGGWGHGAGMCQWGAVGRAEDGQGYREILRAYYSGAEVARVY